MDTWENVSQVFKIRSEVKNQGFWHKYLTFCWFGHEREKGREKKSKFLSTIHGVSLVGIRLAKNQSSLSQRGLRMGTKNEGFRQIFKGGDLGK